MYEHRTLFADNYPNVKQLDDWSANGGWEMFLLFPNDDITHRFIVYLRRMKQAA